MKKKGKVTKPKNAVVKAAKPKKFPTDGQKRQAFKTADKRVLAAVHRIRDGKSTFAAERRKFDEQMKSCVEYKQPLAAYTWDLCMRGLRNVETGKVKVPAKKPTPKLPAKSKIRKKPAPRQR